MGEECRPSAGGDTEPALEVGDTVPDFTVPGVDREGNVNQYSLSDHTTTGAVLLGVYVWDFSPVCVKQLCLLDELNWYQYRTNLSTFGICTEGPYSHQRFAAKQDLDFPLLVDGNGEVLDQLGVLNEELEGIKHVPQRSLFLIGEDRKLQYQWVADDNWEDDNFGQSPVVEAVKSI